MIELHCVCGKLYRVPDDKGGKKLQCRRCGAVQRIPRQKTPDDQAIKAGVVPTAGGDDSSALQLRPAVDRPDLGPALALQAEVRRCPSCGFADDPAIVVCVRCGFDWRENRRLTDAQEDAAVSQRRRTIDTLDRESKALALWTWWSLSPIGLVLGPWVLFRSLAVENHLREAGRSSAVTSQARFVAGLGFAMWLAVAVVGVWQLSRAPEPPPRPQDPACRARLTELARVVRGGQASGRLAPRASLEQGLRQLAPNLQATCPVTAHSYMLKVGVPDKAAPGELILAWDSASHPDAQGRPSWRAARQDGTVEVFTRIEDLEAARDRGPAGQGSEPPPPEVGPGPGPKPPTAPPAGPKPLEAQLAAAKTVARDLEAADPDLSLGVIMGLDAFSQKVGGPPDPLIGQLLRREDPRERAAGASLAGRVNLERGRAVGFARQGVGDRTPEVRFAAALTLRRLGEANWLPLLVAIAAVEGESALGKRASEILGAEALRDDASARTLLKEVANQRRTLQLKGDRAPIPFPPDALPRALALLGEDETAREAAAVLFSAEKAGLDLVLPLARGVRGPDADASVRVPRELQLRAVGVVDKFRQDGAVPLEEYLALVDGLPDPDAQAAALAGLAGAPGPLPPPFLAWALNLLRTRVAKDPARLLCERLLPRVGTAESSPDAQKAALTTLVDDLLVAGDHGAVLRELAAPARLPDERIDPLLRERWGKLEKEGSEEVRLTLVRLFKSRPWEAAILGLFDAAEDPSEAVRVAALLAISQAMAIRTQDVRRQGARVLAGRLKQEKSARALETVYTLAAGGLYCTLGDDPETHKCSPALLRALQTLARKGEHKAIRTLTTHPSVESIETLLGLLVDLKEAQDKMAVAHALTQLTSVQSNSYDPMFWKGQLTPLQPKTKARLMYLATEDAKRTRALEAQAEALIKEIQKRR